MRLSAPRVARVDLSAIDDAQCEALAAFLATDEDGARDLANDLSEYGMQAFPVHGPVPGARVTTP